MADLSDVERALVSLAAAACYPRGTSQPSVVGVPVKAYRGFPSSNALDNDMAATSEHPDGVANVSVFPVSGMTRSTTRFQREWLPDGPAQTSITVAATPTTVTLGGTSGFSQLVGIRNRGSAYVYRSSPTDTPATAAAALAALVPGATCSGVTVTVPRDAYTRARVAGYATVRRELTREQQGFRVTIWAPSRVARDAIGSVLRVALARNNFLQLEDGPARLLVTANDVDDVPTKDRVWRRDFRLTVDYPTTESMVVPAVLWGVGMSATDDIQNANAII